IDNMNRLFGKMWAIPDDLLYWQHDVEIFDFIVACVIEPALLRARLSAIMDTQETLDVLHLKNGSVFEVSAHPKYLGEQITGRVFGFQDITLRMQIERDLRDSRDLLEAR